jgi:pimeloyl-ACP methyl ester carboxylesterase
MVAVVLVAGGMSATPAHAEQVWKPCTETLERWEEVIDDNGEAECTFVTVPLDYSKPDGRKLEIAVSRLKAKGERRGVLLSNPGGPGGSAISYPFDLRTSTIGGVAENYDLIGFDPRGVGFSAAQFCDFPDQPPPPAPRDAEQKARNSFEYEATWNRTCAVGDPEFVAQLTTENTARDMDEIRKALGERKISFYGVSFGTAIGAYYRSLFDSSVDKMWLDSVMPPTMDMSTMDADVAAVDETRFEPFLRWLAARDHDYHLGKKSADVRRTLLALRTELDSHPRGDTDGSMVGALLTPAPPSYAWSATQLMVLLEGGGAASLAAVGDTAHERPRFEVNGFAFNLINNRAVLCNDGTGGRDFAQMWAKRQERLRQYPAAGGNFQMSQQCPDWPVPARPWRLAKGTSALQLSGHIGENVTPYAWARQMQATIGGALLTVNDDQHGSVRRSPCGAKVVEFFRTGRGDNGSCEGA